MYCLFGVLGSRLSRARGRRQPPVQPVAVRHLGEPHKALPRARAGAQAAGEALRSSRETRGRASAARSGAAHT